MSSSEEGSALPLPHERRCAALLWIHNARQARIEHLRGLECVGLFDRAKGTDSFELIGEAGEHLLTLGAGVGDARQRLAALHVARAHAGRGLLGIAGAGAGCAQRAEAGRAGRQEMTSRNCPSHEAPPVPGRTISVRARRLNRPRRRAQLGESEAAPKRKTHDESGARGPPAALTRPRPRPTFLAPPGGPDSRGQAWNDISACGSVRPRRGPFPRRFAYARTGRRSANGCRRGPQNPDRRRIDRRDLQIFQPRDRRHGHCRQEWRERLRSRLHRPPILRNFPSSSRTWRGRSQRVRRRFDQAGKPGPTL